MNDPASKSKGDISSSIAAFAVVGIGASAGGLEALERVLGSVPSDSGMAFVVVQHLDPDQPSAIVSLLQRVTPMMVFEARDGMAVRPNVVYVIPPNRDLSIENGLLLLLPLATPHAPRLPIDHFFRALANDRRENAVGIVLSGMGADGTLGLRSIKENGGFTLAQSPIEAAFDSMPRSAITAGVVDIVVPADKMVGEILACRSHVPLVDSGKVLKALETRESLGAIIALLSQRSRNDFTLYKTTTLYRRIERRVALHRMNSLGDYVSYLRDNPIEIDLLFKELLIGVTNFFRDATVWEAFKLKVLIPLLTNWSSDHPVRAWVPACSTGEEAYSLAMLFREALDAVMPKVRIGLQIYATDIDPDAIVRARQGIFPDTIATDVSPERLARFFVAEENGFRIATEIREMVTFAEQNIISDPPFTKIDILSCRNLLIYFSNELQKTLLPLFHFALNPDGTLILGSAEAIGGFASLFVPVDQKARLFRRVDHPVLRSQIGFPVRAFPARLLQPEDPAGKHGPEPLQVLMERLLLNNYCPAAVLVDGDGDILYISGRTGKYLEPAAGKANLNIHAMARDGLHQPLISAIKRALRQESPVILSGLTIASDKGTQTITVTIQRVDRHEATFDMALIVFTDVEHVSLPPKTSRKAARVQAKDALVAELTRTRADLEVTRAEMQSSLEDLKSANEEQQATNEELQSANEELTTSKEEMQSMNEELHSINAELQSKVSDLLSVNNDMNNLLNSTEIATVFLDNDMRVRRFTPHATQLFKLIPGDVGRPLSDITTDLHYKTLTEDAREVLRTLIFIERRISTFGGAWIKARIMPYRTHDNVIDGVVITFVDISEIKRLEDELREIKGEVSG
ncbi:chemotaxis protein CheB [Magnetospirillum molischianum]|uniref:Putative hybrid two-component sensor-regulator transcriptional histidine kinase fixJ (Modular protein) putative MCP methyltransferase/methylesterase, CheR/CheB with PAS/PAC sensor n=1 Tax=Magnetospirillum molischianum DSM 120 TaxID=1150626 RepID=H8FPD9_MAGML|nr:chemotaxis protein CheB [Magnetospirillum molischianum]CCG40227.1 Putative hybrid two-component sensor-regulator transcriptional histidine kinase fixJ (modular protein); putative MCP methyltransferase/methylesterase, CheR/CheB with PAS/PAC sensor [Magnetospirillum molischianum DSM 120]